MSHNVEIKPTVQTQPAPSNPEPATAETAAANADYSTNASGSENGAVYFELDWQIGQGQNRRQALLTTYDGESPTGYDSDGASTAPVSDAYGGTSYQPTTFGYNGNYHSSNDNLNGSLNYDGGLNDSNLYGYGENSVQANFYSASSDASLSLYLTDDSSVPSWNDLVDLISNYRNFSDFRDQPADFWNEVRRISETKVFQNENGIETENVSEYENLLTQMRSKILSPEEFAETLPPQEKEVFKARYQIEQTFGTNLFQGDGVTLSETGQSRVREVAAETAQTIALPGDARLASREEKAIAFVEKSVPILTRREIANNAKNTVIFGENTLNRPLSKRIESGEIKLQDKSTQIAVGNNTTSILIDNGATRAVNNLVSDNSSSVNAVTRRDGGAAMGGALINGSFASIDNFKNAENKGVGNSSSISNADFDGGKSFAAGATGTMMSAAIGSLIPGSDAVISGVVGFISGVVVGIEADQGLRWLSGERPTEIAPSNNSFNLPEENSFAPNLQLATA